jgi:hypothetical protein
MNNEFNTVRDYILDPNHSNRYETARAISKHFPAIVNGLREDVFKRLLELLNAHFDPTEFAVVGGITAQVYTRISVFKRTWCELSEAEAKLSVTISAERSNFSGLNFGVSKLTQTSPYTGRVSDLARDGLHLAFHEIYEQVNRCVPVGSLASSLDWLAYAPYSSGYKQLDEGVIFDETNRQRIAEYYAASLRAVFDATHETIGTALTGLHTAG